MKRLTYISKLSPSLSHTDIEKIGFVSHLNNQKDDITGVLLCSGGIFFQILEGESDKIDALYQKILRDERHTDILCLKAEPDIQERLFPDWSMKTINLDENTDFLIRPIKTLLQTVTDSHRILEKYTQPTIFKLITSGMNPLEVRPRAVEKIILFSDIVSFSTLAEKLPVEEVVDLVNQYFTICTKIITARGGEVTKFIGDCVMAYFDGERGDDAIQASLEILTQIQILRNYAPAGSLLQVLYTGIGMAKGTVIEGNIGSWVKKDYTIIGDAVNVAARLEALTRNLSHFMVFSVDVKNSTTASWDFVRLEDCQPKGKAEAITIYSIADAIASKPSNGFQIARDISNYIEEKTKKQPITRGIKGWNWGAFFLPGLWCVSNQVWIGLLVWLGVLSGPILALTIWVIFGLILGAKGNEWAWKSGRWSGVLAFKSHQRGWAIASFIFIVPFALLLLLLL